jgi:hypothetical protein
VTAPERHLQGIGKVAAVCADALVPGDVTIWNYGGTYRVLSVERLSPAYVRINMVEIDPISGEAKGEKVWARRTRRSFFVGVVPRERLEKLVARRAAACRHDYADGDVCSKCDAVRP